MIDDLQVGGGIVVWGRELMPLLSGLTSLVNRKVPQVCFCWQCGSAFETWPELVIIRVAGGPTPKWLVEYINTYMHI